MIIVMYSGDETIAEPLPFSNDPVELAPRILDVLLIHWHLHLHRNLLRLLYDWLHLRFLFLLAELFDSAFQSRFRIEIQFFHLYHVVLWHRDVTADNRIEY